MKKNLFLLAIMVLGTWASSLTPIYSQDQPLAYGRIPDSLLSEAIRKGVTFNVPTIPSIESRGDFDLLQGFKSYMTPAGASAIPDSLNGRIVRLRLGDWESGRQVIDGCVSFFQRRGFELLPVDFTIKAPPSVKDTVPPVVSTPIVQNIATAQGDGSIAINGNGNKVTNIRDINVYLGTPSTDTRKKRIPVDFLTVGGFGRGMGPKGPLPAGLHVGGFGEYFFGRSSRFQDASSGGLVGAEIYLRSGQEASLFDGGVSACDSCGVAYKLTDTKSSGASVQQAVYLGPAYNKQFGSLNLSLAILGRYDTGLEHEEEGVSFGPRVRVSYPVAGNVEVFAQTEQRVHPWSRVEKVQSAFAVGAMIPIDDEVRENQRILRDSVARAQRQAEFRERYLADSLAQTEYLSLNPDSLVIDSLLLPDSTDNRRLAETKEYLIKLRLDYNDLWHDATKGGQVLWRGIQRNILLREDAEKRFQRLQRRKDRRTLRSDSRRAEREANRSSRNNKNPGDPEGS